MELHKGSEKHARLAEKDLHGRDPLTEAVPETAAHKLRRQAGPGERQHNGINMLKQEKISYVKVQVLLPMITLRSPLAEEGKLGTARLQAEPEPWAAGHPGHPAAPSSRSCEGSCRRPLQTERKRLCPPSRAN